MPQPQKTRHHLMRKIQSSDRLAVMSTLAIVRPSSVETVIPPPAEDIRVCDQKIRFAAKSLKISLMELAYYGWRLRSLNGYVALGFEDEESYRMSLDVSKTTYYKFMRIGEAFCMLPLHELHQISVGNAELLMQVAPVLWQQFPWIQEAKRLSSQELALRITASNEHAGLDRVPLTWFRVKVPYLAKEALFDMLERFRDKHQLSSLGQALELLIADQYDRPNLFNVIYEAKTILRGALNGLARKSNTVEDRMKYAAEVDAAWRRLNEVWKKEGSEEAGCGSSDEGAS